MLVCSRDIRFTAVSSLSCHGHHLGHIVSIMSAEMKELKGVSKHTDCLSRVGLLLPEEGNDT